MPHDDSSVGRARQCSVDEQAQGDGATGASGGKSKKRKRTQAAGSSTVAADVTAAAAAAAASRIKTASLPVSKQTAAKALAPKKAKVAQQHLARDANDGKRKRHKPADERTPPQAVRNDEAPAPNAEAEKSTLGTEADAEELRRTVYVGNVPVAGSQDKLKKALKAHFSTCVPLHRFYSMTLAHARTTPHCSAGRVELVPQRRTSTGVSASTVQHWPIGMASLSETMSLTVACKFCNIVDDVTWHTPAGMGRLASCGCDACPWTLSPSCRGPSRSGRARRMPRRAQRPRTSPLPVPQRPAPLCRPT